MVASVSNKMDNNVMAQKIAPPQHCTKTKQRFKCLLGEMCTVTSKLFEGGWYWWTLKSLYKKDRKEPFHIIWDHCRYPQMSDDSKASSRHWFQLHRPCTHEVAQAGRNLQRCGMKCCPHFESEGMHSSLFQCCSVPVQSLVLCIHMEAQEFETEESRGLP